MFAREMKYLHEIAGTSFFLLMIASFLFKGTSDYSILLISFGLLFVVFVNSLDYSPKSNQLTLLPLLLTLWLGWILILPMVGLVPQTALFGFFQCSPWIFGFVLFNKNSGAERLWQNLLRLLWVLGLICAVYALFLLLVRNDMPSGFFANKNTAGAFLMMVNILLIGQYFIVNQLDSGEFFLLSQHRRIEIPLILSSIYLLTLALLAVLSRGVIICFFYFTVVTFIFCRAELSRKNIYQIIAILFLALISLFLVAQPAIQNRLHLLANEKSRLIIWQGAWHLWQETPWYGLGIFNFKHYYPAFSLAGDGSNLEYAHNDFLQLFIETGIPGILILFGILLTFGSHLKHYLNLPVRDSITHIKIIACSSALAALVCHSFVDFNFYVLPINLLMGCCLGYLHYLFRKEVVVRVFSLPFLRKARFLQIGFLLCFLISSIYLVRFLIFEHYFSKAETAIKTEQFNKALDYSNKALKWFNFADILSLKMDVYLQLAQRTVSDSERKEWMEKAIVTFDKAIAINPYYARSYFQMALVQALLLEDSKQARKFFLLTLKRNAHFCLARLTFARFLIDKNEFQYARDILEEGLNFPISPEYVELYLNYLAKLRFESGDQTGADEVVQRLGNLLVYNQDYSDLIKSTDLGRV